MKPPPPPPARDLATTPDSVRERLQFLETALHSSIVRHAVAWFLTLTIAMTVGALLLLIFAPIFPLWFRLPLSDTIINIGIIITVLTILIWCGAVLHVWPVQRDDTKAIWTGVILVIIGAITTTLTHDLNPKSPVDDWCTAFRADIESRTEFQVASESAASDERRFRDFAAAYVLFIRAHPVPEVAGNRAGMLEDAKMVQCILECRCAADYLAWVTGIYNNFLGTGQFLPRGEAYYALVGNHAPLHQYLVPNYPDTKDGVYTWTFSETGAHTTTLSALIKSVAPTTSGTETYSMRLDAGEFCLVRARLFPQSESHFFGPRHEVKSMFNAWNECENLTVDDYLESVDPTISDSVGPRHLHIWLYFPASEVDYEPATWRSVLTWLPRMAEDQSNQNGELTSSASASPDALNTSGTGK